MLANAWLAHITHIYANRSAAPTESTGWCTMPAEASQLHADHKGSLFIESYDLRG